MYFSLLWAPLVHAGGGGGSGAGAGGAMALLPQLSQLNLAASVAVVHAASAVGVGSTARIKWPNDVWAGSPTARKLSGTILNFDGKEAAVLGVGINVAQDLSANATATSLQTLRNQLSDKDPSAAVEAVEREAVLAAFCGELERLMSLSPAAVLDEYSRVDLLRGRVVRVHHKTREETDVRDFDALALGVSAEGALRVRPIEPANAAVRELSGEEVSISPLNLDAPPKEEL